MPAVEREEHRVRLRRRPVGRRPRRQEPAPAHHRPRRRVAPGLLAGRADDRVQRPVRRQHRRLHHPARRRHADAADVRTRRRTSSAGSPRTARACCSPRTAHVYSEPAPATLHGAADRRDADAAADPLGLRGRVLAGRRVHRLHAGPRRDARSGSTTAAAPTRASGSTTSKTHEVVEIPQPKDRCNDLDPNWVGNTLYFRSDRAGEYNVFAYDADSKEVKQVTQFTDFPVLDINTDGKKLIFEQAGYLHTADPGRVAADAAQDRHRDRRRRGPAAVREGVEVRPRRRASRRAGRAWPVEFRGEIVTVPAEKGDPRNLTNTAGVHERDPAWSPDGKTIAYFSDEGGEYQLVLAPQNGKGEAKKIKLTGSGFYFDPVWSRDSKKILYRDNSQTLYWLDVESGQDHEDRRAEARPRPRAEAVELVARFEVGHLRDRTRRRRSRRVYVYSLEQDKSFPVTDGLTEATSRCSTRAGSTSTSSLERHRHEQARLQPVGGRQPAAAVVAQPGGAEEGPAEPVPPRERRGEGRARASPAPKDDEPKKDKDARVRDRLRRASTSASCRSRCRPGNYANLHAGRGGAGLLPRRGPNGGGRRPRRAGGGGGDAHALRPRPPARSRPCRPA